MIHSLSGGVIAENGVYLFAKVRVGETPSWYLAPRGTEAGCRVLVPCGRSETLLEGVVERVESCTPQTAPCPLSRVREIAQILPAKS